ncbi:MAG: host attachment protein [Gammaproteobacteria bacterium]|nr:MAG: host attachment protein [Gammaproteobacteria bacterium]
MTEVWVLVADGSEARIYAGRHRRAELELVETLSHEASRLHPRELLADAPGRIHDRFGPGGHSVNAGEQMRAEERQRFAREITALLAEAQRQKKFGGLVVMAAPAFLGVLRESFSKPLAAAIIAEVPKDLVAHDPASIREHVP